MAQTVGLIIAIYAIVRLMQSPLLVPLLPGDKTLPYQMRVLIVACSSAVGAGLIVLLALSLLGAGEP